MLQPKKIKLPPEDAKNIHNIDRSIEARSVELGKMSIQLREMESGLSKLYDFRREIIRRHLDAVEIPDGVRVHVSQTGPDELTIVFLDEEGPEEPTPDAEPEGDGPVPDASASNSDSG